MYQLENQLREQGFFAVCGLDEAGCGPLAGPVYAAAVVLNPEDVIDGLNDSKKLSEKRREALYSQIIHRAIAFGIAKATAEEVDQWNILQARLLAMRRAVEQLDLLPDYLLIDGNRDPKVTGVPGQTIVGGDGKCACIAAASILAKVSRDREMVQLDGCYPQYRFSQHKGYPTKLHIELLRKYGPCPEHRKTFLKKIFLEGSR